MTIDARFLGMLQTVRRDAVLGIVLAVATLLVGIALIATATYLIARASLATMFVDVAVLVAAVRGLAIGRAALRYAERYVTHRATLGMLASLRSATFRALEPRLPAGPMGMPAGDLLARLGPDIDTIDRAYLGVIVPVAAAVIGGGVAVIGLGVVNPELGLVLAIGLGVGAVVVPGLARHLTHAATGRTIIDRGRLQAATADDLAGTAELIAFEATGGFDDRVGRTIVDLRSAETRLGWWRGLAESASASVGIIAALVILLLAIPLVTTGAMDGTLLAVLPLVAIAAFEGALPLATAMDQAAASQAAAARVFAIADSPLPVAEAASPAACPRRGELVAEGVAFRYAPDLPWVIDGVELHVPDGGRLAIGGPSGSGKSTLVDLIVRFREPGRGRLRLAGVDIATVQGDDLRARMAVVPQRPYLFHGTLRDNLLVARGDATDADLLEAMRWAALDGLIATAPMGLDTSVGERGLRLSGGERQRIAIARMWLKDAPIVILDEATAHLDQATEALLTARLDAYLRGRSALILGHRSALLELAGARVELARPDGPG